MPPLQLTVVAPVPAPTLPSAKSVAAPAADLPAIPAAAPSGAQDYRWFVRDPLGLTAARL